MPPKVFINLGGIIADDISLELSKEWLIFEIEAHFSIIIFRCFYSDRILVRLYTCDTHTCNKTKQKKINIWCDLCKMISCSLFSRSASSNISHDAMCSEVFRNFCLYPPSIFLTVAFYISGSSPPCFFQLHILVDVLFVPFLTKHSSFPFAPWSAKTSTSVNLSISPSFVYNHWLVRQFIMY